MTDSPSERLHKLAEEFHKFVNGEQSVIENTDISTEELTAKFGLSLSQAKAWINREPNYSRRKVTTPEWKEKDDGEVTEPRNNAILEEPSLLLRATLPLYKGFQLQEESKVDLQLVFSHSFSTISSFAKPAINSTFNFVRYQNVVAPKLLSAANGVKMNLAAILRASL